MKPIRVGGRTSFRTRWRACSATTPRLPAAAVIGMPDGRSGEFLVALVAPKSGQTAPSTEEVRQFLIGRLSGFKVPHDVLGVEAIEREGRRVDYAWAQATAAALLASPSAP